MKENKNEVPQTTNEKIKKVKDKIVEVNQNLTDKEKEKRFTEWMESNTLLHKKEIEKIKQNPLYKDQEKLLKEWNKRNLLMNKDGWQNLFKNYKDITEVPKWAHNRILEITDKKEGEPSLLNTRYEIDNEKFIEELKHIFDVYSFLRTKYSNWYETVIKNIKIIKDFEEKTIIYGKKLEESINAVAEENNTSTANIKKILHEYRENKQQSKKLKKNNT